MRTRLLLAVASAPLVLACPSARAQDMTPVTEDVVIVTGERLDALAAAMAEKARRPGNVDVVPIEEYQNRYTTSFRDALALTPGVIMQPSGGEDGRLSIRGSGLAQNVHLRGVEVLLNGIPMNAADGFGDVQEFDLLFASHINVLKGGNAFRVGAATLGGAIEVETLSADNAAHPYSLRVEGGSFGSTRVHSHAAHDFGRFDAFLAGTWQRQDGFRDHMQQNNERFYANIGYAWSDRVHTRAGVFLNDVDQELAGSLSLDTVLDTPDAASPGAVAQDWQRDIESVRGFVTTTIDLDHGTIRFGGTAAERTLFHPVPVYVIQDAEDYSAFLRYDGTGTMAGRPTEWSAGLRLRDTSTDAGVLLNFSGVEGPQIGDALQESGTVEAFAEGRIEVVPDVWLIAGLSQLETTRDYTNRLDPAGNADTTFSHLSPKFGLLYALSDTAQLFANVSASYEPPTFSDLTQGGIAGFQPIEAQDAVSYEFGARGSLGGLQFEAALYRQEIEGEFVAFTTTPGIPASIFNADDTVHQGLEVFASYQLVSHASGVTVTPRLSWAWNDFNFDGDAVYGNNRLAGMPEHFGRLELVIATDRFLLVPNVTFQAGDNFLDYANTFDVPGYELYGIEASYEVAPDITLFAEARNLGDKAHVLNYSTLADASDPAANLDVFAPGEGRAVYAGVRIGFGGGGR